MKTENCKILRIKEDFFVDKSTKGLTQITNRIAKDTLIYLFGKGIEGIVGILTISLYTRFFLPEVYSDYNLITTAINIGTVILLSWLTQSGFRYINMYSSPKKRVLFFSTVFRAWCIVNLFIYLICAAGFFYARGANEGNIQYYIIAAAIMFTGFSTSQMLLGFLTAVRQIKLNLILSVFTVTAKVVLASAGVMLTPLGSSTPAAVIIAGILVDFTVILIIFTRMKLYSFINLRVFSKATFRKFFFFGMPIAGMGLAMSLLNLSDRFVIIFSLGKEIGSVKNGIYAANYSLSSAVFTVLMIGMMRGVYPNILKTWKNNDRQMSMSLLTQGIRNYILIAMPCVIGLSVLSDLISKTVLDSDYHSGSNVIIWVSIGMFFLGLTEYSNKPWELTSRTLPALLNSLVCGLLNITVNLLFIPVYGYMTAAVTTAISYFIYYLISTIGGRRALTYKLPVKSTVKILISCAIMGGVALFIKNGLNLLKLPNVLILAVSVLSGVIVYGVTLYLTGEIKYEVGQIIRRLSPERTR